MGAKLISIGHQQVRTIEDVHRAVLGNRRLFLRLCDPASKYRTLSPQSRRLLAAWKDLCLLPPRMYQIRFPAFLDCEAAADASAAADRFGLGGFLSVNGTTIWFSECFTLRDFAFANLDLRAPANKEITSFETLAQLALVWALHQHVPSGRISVRIPSGSDNTGTESVANSLYTSAKHLCFFAQRLALLSSWCGIYLDVSHIAGEKNEKADYLSRLEGVDPVGDEWPLSSRIVSPPFQTSEAFLLP